VNSSLGGLLDKGLHAKAGMKKSFNAVRAGCGGCVTPQMKFQHGNIFSIKGFSGSISAFN
jgi:hypothetical protein